MITFVGQYTNFDLKIKSIMQSSNQKTVNKLKQKNENVDNGRKLEEKIKRKNQEIEQRFVQSPANHLYIFPRLPQTNSNSQSSSSEESIQEIYNLKSQNLRSRKNQTKAIPVEIQSAVKQKQYYSLKSDNSVYSAEQPGRTLKQKRKKSKNIEISFNTKKKGNSQTKTNSSKKLFAGQYSLQNRAYASTKDSKNKLVVSFRGSRNQQINISLSGRRMHTQIN